MKFQEVDGFWIQLFVYTKDCSCTIDYSIAERFIHLLAGEHKGFLFFDCGKMARASAAYHTIVSALRYFKMFFQAIELTDAQIMRICFRLLFALIINFKNQLNL